MNKSQILSVYPCAVEIHAHTMPASTCSRVAPAELIRLYGSIGVRAVAVTNHFMHNMDRSGGNEATVERYLKDYLEAKQEGDSIGVRVILGMELNLPDTDNDYLIYGIDESFVAEACKYLDCGFEEFSERFKDPSRLIIQAHPMRDRMEPVSPKLIDGIETYNMAHKHNSRVALAVSEAAKHPEWITVCGSDYHYMSYEGMGLMRFRRTPVDSFDLVNILKSRDYVFQIADTSVILP